MTATAAVPYSVAVHTKAIFAGLGARSGLDVIAATGVTAVVLWSGDNGEYLGAMSLARRRGLDVISVALPKMAGLTADGRQAIQHAIQRAADTGAPSVSVIFGDRAQPSMNRLRISRLGAVLESSPVPLAIENSGHRAEYFADLDRLSDLLASAPSARLALDLGHLAASGAVGKGVPLQDPIVHVDVHDNDGRHDHHWPLGRGTAAGRTAARLASLPWLPRRVVIETDARCGRNRAAWTAALRNDLAYLTACMVPTLSSGGSAA